MLLHSYKMPHNFLAGAKGKTLVKDNIVHSYINMGSLSSIMFFYPGKNLGIHWIQKSHFINAVPRPKKIARFAEGHRNSCRPSSGTQASWFPVGMFLLPKLCQLFIQPKFWNGFRGHLIYLGFLHWFRKLYEHWSN